MILWNQGTLVPRSMLPSCEMKGERYNFLNFMSRKHTIPFLQLHFWRGWWLVLLLVLLAACGGDETPTPATTAANDSTAAAPTFVSTVANPPALTNVAPTDPPTPEPPTATPEPLAATVNGQPVSLAAFQDELARYTPPGEDPALYRETVLNILINRVLIELAAANFNLTITPEMLDQRISEAQALANESGGATGFTDWLTANGFTEATFRDWVYHEMLAGLVAEVVIADVPFTTEAVRARYIHVTDLALAQNILGQLQNNGDFYTLAQLYSVDQETAQNGGDLDYFSRGTLLIPEIEEVAFALEINQVSDIITITGANGQASYYLVQLIDRDPDRPLNSNQRNRLLEQTFETWLQQQREAAEIIILLS